MNPFIDKLTEGQFYVFMLSSGHTAISGQLLEAGALLVVSGQTVTQRGDDAETYYLNPAHVVAARPK